jgi:hypothetical protein
MDQFEQDVTAAIAKAIAAGRALQRNESAITINAAADRIEKVEGVLREILHAYENTYDAECEPGGVWIAAASIPIDVMERAKALLK